MTTLAQDTVIRLPAPFEKYYIDSRPGTFDVDAAWQYLSTEAYWGRHRSRELFNEQVAKAFMMFGLFYSPGGDSPTRMVGMSRIVGDGDTNLLMDVFVEKAHQGSGLGVQLLNVVLNYDGRDAWRWLLHTGDRKDWYVNKLQFSVVGHAGRGAVLGFPIFVLERDGQALKAAAKGAIAA